MELLVVCIILGILAAVAITVFLNQKDKARKSSATSSLRNVGTAIAALDDQGDFPNADELESESPSYTFVEGTSASTGETVVSVADATPYVIAAYGEPWCYYVRYGTDVSDMTRLRSRIAREDCKAAAVPNDASSGW